MYVLAADIGGTKALMALAEVSQGQLQIQFERRLPSADYPQINDLLQHFLELAQVSATTLDNVVLAVAGPVQEQDGHTRSKLTNLPWIADSWELSAQLKQAPVAIINDFAAIGYALPHLSDNDITTLQEGSPEQKAPRLAVGAGTGLGVCLQDTQHDESHVYPSEGGHVGFAPGNSEQLGLLQYWMNKNGFCSREFLLSGPGIARIGEYIQNGPGPAPEEALGQRMQAGNPSVAISEAGIRGESPFAEKSLQLFVDIYASQLGDLALSYLPRGGLYIAGGIAPKILALLQQERFLEIFQNKPPMQELLQQMPLKVVTTDRVGLIGALHRAAEMKALG